MWQEGNRVAREKGGDPNPMFGPLPKEITDFLAACRSEIFGFGKSMSIPIDA